MTTIPTFTTTITVLTQADKFVVTLNNEYILDKTGARMTFPTTQEAGEAAEAVQRAITGWKTMTDNERLAALRAADSVIPAVAMRHLGYKFPDIWNAKDDNLFAKQLK